MPTLIENIMTLESQASDLVAKAHADAETIANRAEDEIAAARAKLTAETDAKLAALGAETDAKCKHDLETVESQSAAECAAIDGISSAAIQEHAAKVAAAFAKG